MAAKNQFFRLGKFSIKDGSKIRFWEDKRLGTIIVREQYPALYNIVLQKGDTIAKVLESSPLNVTFGIDLSGQRLVSWNALVQCLVDVHLQEGPDEFRWNLHENGKFLCSFYVQCTNST
jgi:hypothetical protein